MPSSSSKAFIFTDTDIGGVIHIANIKGGVGKSTVATNLSAALSKRGPVLLIDLDAQGSATHAFGKDPDDFSFSSFDLFRKRLSVESAPKISRTDAKTGVSFRQLIHTLGTRTTGAIIGKGDIASLRIPVQTCLDLIPANGQLFNELSFFHLQNFLFNMRVCRHYYKYVVLDTPSVWNRLTRTLYANSDLNLIPVTLSALSTKSLRDYLWRVKKLSDRNPSVRIRIVKNEVFGTQDSKIKGKTRTMNENRKFLENLCEQIIVRSQNGISSLPQTMMFDLEIPESATVRDAQDEGKPVQEYQKYSAISRAFEELSRRVQYVLNTQQPKREDRRYERVGEYFQYGLGLAALLVLCMTMGNNPPVLNSPPPRPIAPQQLAVSPQGIVTHYFKDGESIYRVAKYAICRFRAVVPSFQDVKQYINETVNLYNMTRMPEEPKVTDIDRIPTRAVIQFYPPYSIVNQRENQLLPVYAFFTSLVSDTLAYVTGDWCQRGTGGGTPHYGIDVAANLGSKIFSPIEGTTYLHESASAGRMVGVVKEGSVLFFCHMDRRFVKSGQQIKKGEPVGTVGLTGATSGPHVHVGYGIRSPAADGVVFGGYRYKLTDPKLFFYRQAYVNSIEGKKD
jgi:cellulose biosynthesis protein BcsQ